MLSKAAKTRALNRGPGFWGFMLAHHFRGQLHHCYQIWLGDKALWICSRCLGLYPVLAVVLIIQLFFPVQAGWYDILWLFLAPLPALVDWGLSRIGLWRGSNLSRTLTGALMGVSLARTVYLNIQDTLGFLVIMQLVSFIVVVGGVELLSRNRTLSQRGHNADRTEES